MKKKMVVLFLAAIMLLAAIPVFADWYPGGSMGGSPAAVREYSAGKLYNEYTFKKTYVKHTWVAAADKVVSCPAASYTYYFYVDGQLAGGPFTKKPQTIPISNVSFKNVRSGRTIGLRVVNPWQDGVTNMPIQGIYVPYFVY